jgi:hypothetical protein
VSRLPLSKTTPAPDILCGLFCRCSIISPITEYTEHTPQKQRKFRLWVRFCASGRAQGIRNAHCNLEC